MRRSGWLLASALVWPCVPPIGNWVGAEGHHDFVWCRSRSLRHHAINDIIWHALLKADVPSTKEPAGLFRSDGKRPDVATLIPWIGGKYLIGHNGSPYLCGLLHRSWLSQAGIRAGNQPSDPKASHLLQPM